MVSGQGEAVIVELIEPLKRVFTVPKSAEKNEMDFFDAYIRSLKTFSSAVLRRAAERIIDTREARTFPLPAECNKACRDALHALASERASGQNVDNRLEIRNAPLEVREPTCNPNRRKRTDEMFAEYHYSGDAIEAGWGWTLWDWMNERERVPDPHELIKLEVESKMKASRFQKMLGTDPFGDVETLGNAPIRDLLLFWQSVNGRLANLVREKYSDHKEPSN